MVNLNTRQIYFNEIKKGDRVVMPDNECLSAELHWDGEYVVATSDAYEVKIDNEKVWNFESGDEYVYITDIESVYVDIVADDANHN